MGNVDSIILDTSKHIQCLHFTTTLLDVLNISDAAIMQTIFDSIQFDQKAEEELAFNCADVVRDCMGDGCDYDLDNVLIKAYNSDITKIGNAIYALGIEILKELRFIKAYEKGYLFFQFFKMLDKDIVLERFIPPNINIR